MKSLCVLGLGYIGLPTAAMFATHGIMVQGMDVNRNIISRLQNKDIHIEEPGLKELILKAFDTGLFTVSNEVAPADAYIIAVPTPFKQNQVGEFNWKEYKLSDMGAVISATESIVPQLKKGDLVILESTSPVRTTADIVKPILEKSGLAAGIDFSLAYSPERVLPGQIIRELEENARVIGGIDRLSAEKGKELYLTFVKGEIILTDASTAEMVKLMENTYRDVNIAIANEFSRLADRFGVDVWEAISIANHHPRVKILNPGPGVGGHCISIDPWFFVESAPDLSNLLWMARQVNDSQPAFVVEIIKRALGSLQGKRICAFGLSYKANVDDIRESPAVDVVRLLQQEGALVKAFEPYKLDAQLPGITTTSTMEEALRGSDVVVILVAHRQFLNIRPRDLKHFISNQMVISTVGGFNDDEWKAAGFKFIQLGNGKSRWFSE